MTCSLPRGLLQTECACEGRVGKDSPRGGNRSRLNPRERSRHRGVGYVMRIQLIRNSPKLDASSTAGIERPQVDVLAARKTNNIFFELAELGGVLKESENGSERRVTVSLNGSLVGAAESLVGADVGSRMPERMLDDPLKMSVVEADAAESLAGRNCCLTQTRRWLEGGIVLSPDRSVLVKCEPKEGATVNIWEFQERNYLTRLAGAYRTRFRTPVETPCSSALLKSIRPVFAASPSYESRQGSVRVTSCGIVQKGEDGADLNKSRKPEKAKVCCRAPAAVKFVPGAGAYSFPCPCEVWCGVADLGMLEVRQEKGEDRGGQREDGGRSHARKIRVAAAAPVVERGSNRFFAALLPHSPPKLIFVSAKTADNSLGTGALAPNGADIVLAGEDAKGAPDLCVDWSNRSHSESQGESFTAAGVAAAGWGGVWFGSTALSAGAAGGSGLSVRETATAAAHHSRIFRDAVGPKEAVREFDTERGRESCKNPDLVNEMNPVPCNLVLSSDVGSSGAYQNLIPPGKIEEVSKLGNYIDKDLSEVRAQREAATRKDNVGREENVLVYSDQIQSIVVLGIIELDPRRSDREGTTFRIRPLCKARGALTTGETSYACRGGGSSIIEW
ncbi:hypothetical protein B0H14DRAFT_3171011 [Mycena olivaceomarginata]|nr:hypothetical protein B0H14DRAFT_3171011 [Mycena olivaceomarginata]